MLTLKRKPREKIVIFNENTGELIAIIENVGTGNCNIGVATESHIRVLRHEKYLQIIEEMEAKENA